MPPSLSSQDYWSASKLYFQLATARNRLNEPAGSLSALAQSLAYYRKGSRKSHRRPRR